MSIMTHNDPFAAAQVIDLVIRERQLALSLREWKHRLAGYGYTIRDTDHGQVIETLRHHIEVGVLPTEMPTAH